jgi:hypothetical protein
VFHNVFLLAAHPNLSKIHDGTPKNFASLKGCTKLYMAIGICLVRKYACGNETLHMCDKIIDDEPVCVCVCVFVCFTNSNCER